ncbi:MAG: tail protein X [Puniceicoccales bacterium]|jgi:phage tail protein X|nr:tail protein X [Puniceicoccales bacterium]
MQTDTTIHRTADGDMLDAIGAAQYDGDVTMLPVVLALNPGLAGQPPILPSGLEIIIPPAKRPVRETQRLWD